MVAVNTSAAPRLYVVRWMVAGALLGMFFMLVSWRFAIGDAGMVTFAELHAKYPTLWIVDLAPTALGLAGAVIGVLFTRLADSKQRTESAARRMAASWVEELHATNVELAETLEARRRLHASVTHELRTPLATIVGFTNLAADPAVDAEELPGYLAEIQGAASTMQALVDDVIDAAKLESRGIPLELTFVPAEEAIYEVVARMKPLAEHKGLQLRCEVEEGLACRADPLRLRQVLSNVISNAIKYSDRGTIDVSGFRQRNGVPVVAVRDEGIGIKPEDLSRVFRVFESGGNGIARSDSSGLGLAICVALMSAMDGELSVESDGEGLGSTFRMTLKAANHQAAESRVAVLDPGREPR